MQTEIGRVSYLCDYPSRTVVLYLNTVPERCGLRPHWKEAGRCTSREELESFVLTIDGVEMTFAEYLRRLPDPSIVEDAMVDLSWFWSDMAETASV